MYINIDMYRHLLITCVIFGWNIKIIDSILLQIWIRNSKSGVIKKSLIFAKKMYSIKLCMAVVGRGKVLSEHSMMAGNKI